MYQGMRWEGTERAFVSVYLHPRSKPAKRGYAAVKTAKGGVVARAIWPRPDARFLGIFAEAVTPGAFGEVQIYGPVR